MWDIYVIGDVKFLQAILNGIAMIFKGNSIWVAAKIFILLSVLHLGVQAVLNNSFMQIQYLAVTWLLLSALFIPRVTVSLHDRNSLLSVNVAGVPVGLAVFASFTSNIGKHLSDIFERSFSSVHDIGGQAKVTQSFEQLLALRANVLETMLTSSGDKAQLYYSWQEYLKNCTNVALNLQVTALGAKDMQNLLSSSLPEAVRFPSEIYYVRLLDKNGNTYSTLTCTEAFARLKSQTLENTQSLLRQNQPLGKDKLYNLTTLNQDITTLSHGHLDAQKYIIALSMAQMITQQPEYANLGAAVLTQSLSSIYTQWSLQGSIFTNTVKPLLTFLEGFFYAVVPFIFLLLMLGQFGLRMLGKFIVLLVWLQMWQPIISIINLYYQQLISKEIFALKQSYIAIDSFWGITLFNQKIESYVSTSGMLLASVGSLALFLIYGGAVAATSLASKFAPATPSASATLTPNVVQAAPVVQAGSVYSSTAYEGTHTAGAQTAIGTISLESSRSALQSAQEQLLSLSRASYVQGGSSSLTSSSGVTSFGSQETLRSSGHSLTSSDSETLSTSATSTSLQGYTSVSSATSNNSFTASGAGQLGGGLSGGASAGFGGQGGVRAGVGASASTDVSQKELQTQSTHVSNSEQTSASQSQTHNRSSGLLKQNRQAQMQQEEQRSSQGATTHATQESSGQYSQEIAQMQQVLERVASNQSISVLALAQSLSANPQASAYVASLVSANPHLARTALANERALASLIPDQEQRRNAANVQAIFGDTSAQGDFNRVATLYAAFNGQVPSSMLRDLFHQATGVQTGEKVAQAGHPQNSAEQVSTQVTQTQAQVSSKQQEVKPSPPVAPQVSPNSNEYSESEGVTGVNKTAQAQKKKPSKK
ncbi:conjugal transfer protein TraG N-terminal domain-containing protein [Psittacicella gerlachiana]|uniref:TraG N-terminal Proteobacteria domain-containing protein n=1 Tax=Psittacicella gerlachiana TaxID=2028574 RepID=A0A3A1YJL2_9GAMM|nr:conjugal transfer protein TraG N-terminal domain-containing protein [Psittacicella gerlachiana]RIY37439.1 hypothetical protein CKF59_01725 [Psittacicella gerlachiana]